MGSRETNIDSIRALDREITELKRARNSLLNISTRVPPEILGSIFVWTLAREPSRSLSSPHFDGLRKGSYNFLLVCHHWFEVASRTPELWSFWGNSLEDWKKRHHRSGTTSLDLVLDGFEHDTDIPIDGSIHSAIRARVAQGTIRQVHLATDDSETMAPIISSLTPNDTNDAQNDNIESIVLQNGGVPPVDVSNFFARSHLSKLHLLYLSASLRISSWDHLASRTTRLTALSLKIDEGPQMPVPTTSQIFSILASNPNLQQLVLSNATLPNDTDGSTLKMSLPNLKLLSLVGEFRRLSGFLCLLILPATLVTMDLIAYEPVIEEISQTLGPYMRDHFRRDARFRDGLEVSSSVVPSSIDVSVKTLPNLPTTPASVRIRVLMPLPHAVEQLLINLIALIPSENAISFISDSIAELPEEMFFMMPNIEALHLTTVEFSEGFLQPNPHGLGANTKLLPSLRSLCLEDITLDNGDWVHLMTYLVHQTSGDRTISLKLTGNCPYVDPVVVNLIKDLVEEFTITVADASNEQMLLGL